MSVTAPMTCASCGRTITSARLRGLCAACLVRGAKSAGGLHRGGSPAEEEAAEPCEALFRIPGHDVLEEIARGGMGIVYRARQHDPAREVAVKMLLPGGATPALRERFRNEARTMAELNHPGVLPLYQFGEHGGTPWFTMKLAGGGTLAGRIKNPDDPLRTDVRKAAALTAEIAEAVAYAHERGVLHRDLKPGNILFDTEGRACVADFGLAKLDTQSAAGLTHSRAMLGTPHYLAPELAAKAGATATVATDVYALGAILYELLAGHPPFQSETLAGLLRRIVEDDPPSLLAAKSTHSGIVPRGLAAIAGKAMAKEPARRYRDAAALAADLRAWLCGEAIEARPPGTLEKTTRWARRHPAWAAAIAALIAGVSAVIVLQAKAGRDLRAERDVAASSQKLAVAARADALAAQVSAARVSGRLDMRNTALEAAREAARLKVTPDLRDDVITLLATPGWAQKDTLEGTFSEMVPLSPDHDFMVTQVEGKLTIHDLSGKAPPHILPPLPPDAGAVETINIITRAAAHITVRTKSSSHFLYSRAEDKWVRRWSQPFWGFALSADETRLALGVDGGKDIVIEDFLTGKEYQRLRSSKRQCVPRAFSPDGKWLVVSGSEEGGVDVYELATGSIRHSLETIMVDQQFPNVSWRPDSGGFGLAMGATDLYIYTLDGPKQVQERVAGHQAEAMDVTWHPDGRWLASCGFDSTIRIFEIPGRREVLRIPVLAGSVHFSRDGRELACREYRGGKIHRFTFTTPANTAQCPLPRNTPDVYLQRPSWGCALTPDGVLGVTVSILGIHYFEAATGRRLGWQSGHYPSDLAFNEKGDVLFGAGRLGVLSLPVRRAGTLGHELVLPDRDATLAVSNRAYRFGWSEARQRIAWTCADGVGIKDLPDGPVQMMPRPPFEMNPCTLSPDGRWLVTSGGDYAPDGLVIWDTDHPASPLILSGFTTYSYPRFSPDSRTLYVSTDNRLCALRTGTWEQVWSNNAVGQPNSQRQVALSGDGRILATAEGPGSVGLYDTPTGRRIAMLRYPNARWIGWIAMDYCGARLLTTTLPDSVISWDLRALRAELASMGLDWDAPPYPPGPKATRLHLRFPPPLIQ